MPRAVGHNRGSLVGHLWVTTVCLDRKGALDTDTLIPLMLSSALGGPQQARPLLAVCRVLSVESVECSWARRADVVWCGVDVVVEEVACQKCASSSRRMQCHRGEIGVKLIRHFSLRNSCRFLTHRALSF